MKSIYAMDNVIECDEGYFFVSLYNNGIYRINDDNLNVERISQIPFRFKDGCMEYSKIYAWNHKFCILPWFSDKIAIFDRAKDEYRFIKLNEFCRGLRYLKAYQDKEKLYLIPCENKDILVIDLDSEKIVESIEIQVKNENREKVIAWCEICIDENTITIPQVYESRLIKYNYKQGKTELIDNPIKSITGLCGICDTSGGRWYIPRRADRLYFVSENEEKQFRNFPKAYLPGDISFYKIIPDENRIFLLPRDANMFLVAYEDGTIHELMKINPDSNNDMEKYMYFSNVWFMGNKRFCIESNTGKVYEITDENKLMEKEFAEIIHSEMKMDSKEIFYENLYHEHTLDVFIKSVKGE